MQPHQDTQGADFQRPRLGNVEIPQLAHILGPQPCRPDNASSGHQTAQAFFILNTHNRQPYYPWGRGTPNYRRAMPYGPFVHVLLCERPRQTATYLQPSSVKETARRSHENLDSASQSQRHRKYRPYHVLRMRVSKAKPPFWSRVPLNDSLGETLYCS